jgi:hypothetical protein
LIAAVAIALGMTSVAWAFPPSNPFTPDAANIQAMIDRTSDFSGGNQASSETHTNIPGGLKLNVDWYTGSSAINESFTRIVMTHQYATGCCGNAGLRGDLSGFDGVKWLVSSDQPLAVKPYTQTGTSFTFYEGTQPNADGAGTITVPGDSLPHVVQIDWNMVNNGGSIPLGPGPSTRQDIFEHGFQIFMKASIFEHGFQIFMKASPPQDTGIHIPGMVTITAVPEPASLALASIATLGLVGLVRRQMRK